MRHAALTESHHHAEVSRLNAELEAQAQVQFYGFMICGLVQGVYRPSISSPCRT